VVETVAEVLELGRPAVAAGDVTPRKCDTPEARKRKGKSRVTNGSRLLPDVPGTNPWVRRCRDIITGYVEQLNGSATVAERAIIRRIAVLETELERRESAFAKAGEASDSALDVYQRASGNHRRLLESIGINKSKPQQNAEAD
jgi:hypothetical protein